MSAKSRNVYLVMAHNQRTSNTYVSQVLSSKKEAEEYRTYISDLMQKHQPDYPRTYWVSTQKVS